jgi:hypothetical protein
MPRKAEFVEAAAQRGVAAYLKGFKKRGENLRPIWEGIIHEFHEGEKQVLKAEGFVGGWHDKYPKLEDDYRAWKRRVAPGKRILELTGTMYRHLTQNPAPDCWYIKDLTTLTILPGLKLPNHPGDQIAVHQMGREGLQTVTTETHEGGCGPVMDWETSKVTVSTRGVGGLQATKMKPRPPVRLTKRGVKNIGGLVARYMAYDESPGGGG